MFNDIYFLVSVELLKVYTTQESFLICKNVAALVGGVA